MDDLGAILPTDLRGRVREDGNELLFSYPDVIEVINLATRHGIAILGVEAFQVLPGSLLVLGYSVYEILDAANWSDFVQPNNAQALVSVQEFPCGKEHGYILTSTSELESQELRNKKNTT